MERDDSIRPSVAEELDYVSLCDAVARKLKKDILSGALKPGERLLQTQLAKRFGISRMPVRDALRKLASEGLVTIIPERGAEVSMLDLPGLQEACRILEVLEVLAGELAIANATDNDIQEIDQMLKRMDSALDKRDLASWFDLDMEFHRRIVALSKAPRLLRMLSELYHLLYHVRRGFYTLPGKADKASKTHNNMVAALAARDGEQFTQLTRQHVVESLPTILEIRPDALKQR